MGILSMKRGIDLHNNPLTQLGFKNTRKRHLMNLTSSTGGMEWGRVLFCFLFILSFLIYVVDQRWLLKQGYIMDNKNYVHFETSETR